MPTSLSSVTLPVEACEGAREEVMKAKEQAILILGRTLAKNKSPEGWLNEPHIFFEISELQWFVVTELGVLIQTTRDMIDFFSKAKAAKLLRELVDSFLDMGHATGKEVSL